jgi:hypothetical protein
MKTLIALLVVHFIADFICQPREMGKKKSYEVKWLAGHLAIQFVFFCAFGWKLALINAAIHGIIDWNIWRLYKLSVGLRFPDMRNATPEVQKAYPYYDDHLFYTTIGLDQMLHTITLVVLWSLFL